MSRSAYLLIIAALLLSGVAKAEDAPLEIRVVDVTNNNIGVASTVFVDLPQAGGNLPLGDTLDDGKLDVHYTCKVGYRLWAKPKIDAYFTSLKADCRSPITLRLVPRQTSIGEANAFVLKTYGGDSATGYTFVSQLVLHKDIRPVGLSLNSTFPTSTSERCEVDLKPSIVTSVFQKDLAGLVNKVAEIKSSSETNANLTDETSVFNLPCGQAAIHADMNSLEYIKKNEAYLVQAYDKAQPSAASYDDLQKLITKYAKPSG